MFAKKLCSIGLSLLLVSPGHALVFNLTELPGHFEVYDQKILLLPEARPYLNRLVDSRIVYNRKPESGSYSLYMTGKPSSGKAHFRLVPAGIGKFSNSPPVSEFLFSPNDFSSDFEFETKLPNHPHNLVIKGWSVRKEVSSSKSEKKVNCTFEGYCQKCDVVKSGRRYAQECELGLNDDCQGTQLALVDTNNYLWSMVLEVRQGTKVIARFKSINFPREEEVFDRELGSCR